MVGEGESGWLCDAVSAAVVMLLWGMVEDVLHWLAAVVCTAVRSAAVVRLCGAAVAMWSDVV